MNVIRFGLVVSLGLGLASCGEKAQDVAVIRTDMGTIVIAFYDDTPRHVENFKKLAREGFYNGTAFHRIMEGMVIQGGDPNSKDANRENDGSGGPGYTLPAEILHRHVRGAVGAARDPDQANPERESNGSQFYICAEPVPFLDNGYTVFGYVVEGLDVVQRILKLERDRNDNPLRRVEMKDVSITGRVLKYPAFVE